MANREYFCLLTPGREGMHGNLSPGEQQIFGEHCQYLQRHFEAGAVLQAGTSFEQGQDGFAIVILSAADKAKAEAIMAGDPAVAHGLLKSRVTEYDIFLDRGQP